MLPETVESIDVEVGKLGDGDGKWVARAKHGIRLVSECGGQRLGLTSFAASGRTTGLCPPPTSAFVSPLSYIYCPAQTQPGH